MAKKKKRKKNRSHRADRNTPDFLRDVRIVQAGDTFRYQCICCGDCCRNVQDAVMLESLDAFRIARYFKQSGRQIEGVEEIYMEYAHPINLDDKTGYPIFLLNTEGPQNTCVFLADNRCTIQPAKPRACRLYPLSAGPKDSGSGFEYAVVSQKPHHFTGPDIRVGDWMNDNFSKEDTAFVSLDMAALKEQATLILTLKRLGTKQEEILRLLLWFKYFLFDLDKEFMPQYERNMRLLRKELLNLLERGGQ